MNTPTDTPETDKFANTEAPNQSFRDACRAWVEFARKLERERDKSRARVIELEIIADLATQLDTSQDCDPTHHGLVCAAMTALNNR